jgi:hypothetical protein
MPSVSTAQQALMGQAYAIKIGSMKPSELDPKYKKEILSLADRMTKKELEDFASTKHKGLPHHVSESDLEIESGTTNSENMSEFLPKGPGKFHPKGPGKIVPFLNPDFKQKIKGKKNLQNLKDYRDWIGSK